MWESTALPGMGTLLLLGNAYRETATIWRIQGIFVKQFDYSNLI